MNYFNLTISQLMLFFLFLTEKVEAYILFYFIFGTSQIQLSNDIVTNYFIIFLQNVNVTNFLYE